MAKNIYGGGSRTNINGLRFEQETDFETAILKLEGYEIRNDIELFYKGKKIGKILKKNKLYKNFLEVKKVNYKDRISKKLLPDEAIYIYSTKTLYILEKKFQNSSGSVDEKLQTCDFKIKQYRKLVFGLNIKVEYIYILSDWFMKDSYRDVLEYINSVGCSYYFNEIPLEDLGIVENAIQYS